MEVLTVQGNELRQFGAKESPPPHYKCCASVIAVVGTMLTSLAMTVWQRIEPIIFPDDNELMRYLLHYSHGSGVCLGLLCGVKTLRFILRGLDI